MTGPSAEARGVKLALVAYSGLFVVQLVTFFLTNIMVILAQSLEVLSDVIVSVFLLLSIHWSRKPPDEYHMFGHGRAQNVAALVAGTIMILFMSLTVFQEAIPRLLQPLSDNKRSSGPLAFGVLLVSMLVLAVPLIAIVRTREKGASVKAQKVQLLKDEVAYLPALTGVVLVNSGYHLADPATSIIIAAVILLGGVYLFKSNVEYLVGKSPGKDFLDKVESVAKSVDGVQDVHSLKAEFIGPGIIHAGFHVNIARSKTVEEADRIVKQIHDKVREQADCQDCVIQIDPAS